MKYKIHNDNIIKQDDERINCKNLIKKQASRLDCFSLAYPKELLLNLYFNSTAKDKYQITAVIRLKHRTIVVKQSGKNIEAIVFTLFDRLKLALSKRLQKEQSEHSRHAKNIRIRSISENLPELIELKNEDSDDLLKDILKLLLNDIAKYTHRRLKTAEMTSSIKRGMFKTQDLLDEIYLIVYERLEEIPAYEDEILIWLHKVVDEHLDEKFQEMEFEKEHFDRIENILEADYQSMKEDYTIGADYDIVPMEELDEFEAPYPLYSVNQLEYEAGEDYLLDDLILKMNDKELHAMIEKELMKLPVLKRTIMDLYLLEQMTAKEIANIKGISFSEVETIINEVISQLKKTLSSFFY
jgi:DNA-directed RNA polymerase specialized sigma24 family protein